MNFLKAIRYPNLIIIALTQYLMRYAIMEPLVDQFDLELIISDFDFFLLVLSSVLIAAGGNIINDYFDLKIDRINKPEKIIIGRTIKRRVAMAAHWTFTVVGGLMALYMSWHVGLWKLVIIQGFVIFSLWEYSLRLKHMPGLGNFLIAVLAALVPLLVGFYEIPLLNGAYAADLAQVSEEYGSTVTFNSIAYWILGFSGFAFLMTLAREIVKDIADVPGDRAYGSRTIPIAYGVGTARYIALTIQLATIAAVLYVVYGPLKGQSTTAWYSWVALILPMLFMCYKLFKAQSREDYLSVSAWNKGVSVLGVLYAIVAYSIFQSLGAA